MSEPSTYILEGWDEVCATANASLNTGVEINER